MDTRKLTRSIRDHGSRKALLTDIGVPTAQAVARLNAEELRRDQVAQVSCKKRWYARTSNHRFSVVAVDCGIKLNIVRSLNARGCNVTVVPYDTPWEVISDMEPDGVFLSNGPGDPEDVKPVIELVRALRGTVPIFGICLGHQMIALAWRSPARTTPTPWTGTPWPARAWRSPTSTCWTIRWRAWPVRRTGSSPSSTTRRARRGPRTAAISLTGLSP